jgi:hypothetical protein
MNKIKINCGTKDREPGKVGVKWVRQELEISGPYNDGKYELIVETNRSYDTGAHRTTMEFLHLTKAQVKYFAMVLGDPEKKLEISC